MEEFRDNVKVRLFGAVLGFEVSYKRISKDYEITDFKLIDSHELTFGLSEYLIGTKGQKELNSLILDAIWELYYERLENSREGDILDAINYRYGG